MLILSACGGISTGIKVLIRANEPETSKGKSLLSPERKRQITEEGGKQWGLPENRGNLIGILYIGRNRHIWDLGAHSMNEDEEF